ncbi:bleomycin resistance protein [Flavihumibacter petaseus]|nr:VOC family protein [Flavihumibacter petaseus]
MKNKFESLRPLIRTRQLDETIQFYETVLGFRLGEKNEDWGWAALFRGDVEIMLARPNDHLPFEKPVFTGSFYILVSDVEALWQEVKDKATVVYPIESFEWGMREFAICDNNGYMLQFGQDIPVSGKCE